LLLVIALALLASPSRPARAAGGDAGAARAYFDKATASFALGLYADAAENFEKAFQARPDPALLYNAAQAHRLDGNKPRALTLYQNYLRIYSKGATRAEVEARVAELKKAIEQDRQMATTPPTTTTPSTPATPGGSEVAAATGAVVAAPPEWPARAPSPAAETGAVDLRAPPPADTGVAARAEAPAGQPLTSKPLFWGAVGGGIVVVMSVVLIVALSGAKDPAASLGVVR
jgi:tetratricopeptide (TPR) repeat protein